MYTERLQKFMAHAGVASRRACEKIIAAGRVSVNGVIITDKGVKVNPLVDTVKVDGAIIRKEENKVYILLNKPVGVITSVSDEFDRDTVLNIVKVPERIYPIGRLDYNTSGVLLLTNDGNVAHNLTHPSRGVWKKYMVEVSCNIQEKIIESIRKGIRLEDGITAPAKCKLIYSTPKKSRIELSIHEGRNRQIRRMFNSLNIDIISLTRTEFGPIKLGKLVVGKWRHLTNRETQLIMKAFSK